MKGDVLWLDFIKRGFLGFFVFDFCNENWIYKDKVYFPRQVREKLGLVNGDVLQIVVVERGIAKISVVRRCGASKRTLEALDNRLNPSL